MLTNPVADLPKEISMRADRIKAGCSAVIFGRQGTIEGVIDVARFNEVVPKDVQDKVMAVHKDIVNDKFKVPEIYECLTQPVSTLPVVMGDGV
jgi:hypothetical protein